MDSAVGADAYIGPLGSYEFAEDYRKISIFCRADVGIGPYRVCPWDGHRLRGHIDNTGGGNV